MISRMKIVGEITRETPECVIEEIANSFLLNINKSRLSEKKYFNSILELIKKEELRQKSSKLTIDRVAQFVNPRIEWRESVLEEAYNHLIKFYNDGYEMPKDDDFQIGPKNMTYPNSYDATMLYKICKSNNIIVNL